jgi:chemotaxis protein methyltransferase CheR
LIVQQQTFDEFRRIVYTASGIALGPSKDALVSARVGKRMRALGIRDYESYLRCVSEDRSGDEVGHLVDVISTNVTSFFREDEHFTFMAEALTAWIAEGRERFRFWSAACATGEEPYSLAMTLLEAAGDRRDLDMRILATDISSRALRKAMPGVYEEPKTRSVPADLLGRHFVRRHRDGQTVRAVAPHVKCLVTFRRHNLSAPPYPIRGPLDAVFLRNVMIYFDQPVRIALLTEVHRLLRPGGYLIVGHAESLAGLGIGFSQVKPSIYTKR